MPAFPTTRWSLIRASQLPPPEAAAAWSALVRDYRPAILAYFRRSVLAREAEDLTQEFLLGSLQAGSWSRADAEQGSFRRFLHLLLKRFLLQRANTAQQRREVLGELPDSASAADSPEAEFDLQFALCLTRDALAALRAQCAREGKQALLAHLEPWLGEPPAHGELAALAQSLDLAPNTLAVQLHRLRQRLQRLIRDALAELCLQPEQVEHDLAALRQALARGS